MGLLFENININDTILYLVNFSDNKGYSVLSASEKLGSDVLFITENGSADPNLFYNVNTKSNQEIDNNLPIELLRQYVDLSITSPTIPDGKEDEDSDFSYGGLENIPPMIKTKWGQENPYNNCIHIPECGEDPRPAGCSTIALAQVLAYLQPGNIQNYFSFSDESFTWSDLVKERWESEDTNNIYYQQMGLYIEQIADGIGVSYNYLGSGGTFAMASDVKSYMEELGYNVTKHNSYSSSVVSRMIQSNKPILISALLSAETDLFNGGGHHWVIDGVKLVTQDYKTHAYYHCNWGWNGTCDGYYYDGIFDLRNGPIYIENGESQSDTLNSNFTWWFKLLTY